MPCPGSCCNTATSFLYVLPICSIFTYKYHNRASIFLPVYLYYIRLKDRLKVKKQLKKENDVYSQSAYAKYVSTYLSFIQILGLMSKMQHLVFIHTKISARLMHQRETTEYVWFLYHLINCINLKRVKTTGPFSKPALHSSQNKLPA
jgi:uncharacterized protein YlbG (UPF0298 family)